jgi:hypothetical protein
MSDWTVGAPAETGLPTGMVSLADMLESITIFITVLVQL